VLNFRGGESSGIEQENKREKTSGGNRVRRFFSHHLFSFLTDVNLLSVRCRGSSEKANTYICILAEIPCLRIPEGEPLAAKDR
jgi:hypothetical protein